MMKIIDVQISEQLRTKAKKLPMYKEFIELVDKDKKVQRYYNMRIMLLDAFKWDSTPQGHEYWQSVFDSIEVKKMKFCPQCNTRNRVCFLKVNKNYKCYKCKITFQ